MTTTYEIYTNDGGTPKAVTGNAPAIVERVENLETAIKNIDVGVTSFNGSKGAVTYTAPVTSVNGQTGSVNIPTGHNVGEEWVSYVGDIPTGGVPYCGQEVNRSTYSALWEYANAKGLVKSESEWQSLYNAQGGNVAFYSSGNGSSTFRMPRLVGYVRGAGSQSESGSYVKEGLPNIVGKLGVRGNGVATPSGSFYINGVSETLGGYYSDNAKTDGLSFDASRSNPIYGNSSHVTPETSVVLYGVYAFGEIGNVDNLDVGTLTSAFAALESNVGSKLNGVVRSVNGVGADASGNVTLNTFGVPTGDIVTLTSSNVSNYTAPSNGFMVCKSSEGNMSVTLNGKAIGSTSEYTTITIPVKKGDVIVCTGNVSGNDQYFVKFA